MDPLAADVRARPKTLWRKWLREFAFNKESVTPGPSHDTIEEMVDSVDGNVAGLAAHERYRVAAASSKAASDQGRQLTGLWACCNR